MDFESDKYWLWLSSLSSLLSQRTRDRLPTLCSPEELYKIKDDNLQKLLGVREADEELIKNSDISVAEDILGSCEKNGISFITYADSQFPQRLKSVYAPPAVLYMKGTLPDIDSIPFISVIGTRKPTAYGIKTGVNIGFEIVKCGGGVVSLLTPGAGTSAAEGAISANGACVAVLATPVNEAKGDAFDRLVESGAAVSEYPPGCKHSKLHYRERNRLASGLSVGVVVIEAPSKSGTRLFVDDALEQGKDVFAVPGNVDSANSEGTIDFIRAGAIPVACGWDIMKEYSDTFSCVTHSKERFIGSQGSHGKTLNTNSAKSSVPNLKVDRQEHRDYIDRDAFSVNLSPDQKLIVNAISENGSTVDEIINASGLSAAKVLSQLTVLEIKGKLFKDASNKIKLNY